MPTVPVRKRKDVYDVLTVKKDLAGLIDQYLDSLEKKTLHVSRMKIGESDLNPKWIEERRDSIIELFLSMKKSLKIENMNNLYAEGFTRREESDILGSEISPSRCVLCGSVARIHCVNCDGWICLNHWK